VKQEIVSKFLHTRMRVNDLERTLEFYQRVFGLEVTRRHESPRGSKLAFLAVPNSDEEIEITYFPGSGPVKVQEDLMHLAFEVKSMKAFQEHLDQIGVPLSDGPTQSSSGSVFAFVDAPEGYEIEVIERPKMRT
jgi:lactoylglutathione lyase